MTISWVGCLWTKSSDSCISRRCRSLGSDIPYFKAGTEALHGVAWSNDLDNNWGSVLATDATVFPQAVGLASTWDTDLINDVGSAVGDELRAYNSLDPQLWGLQAWAPVVDPLRDPRWGRNEEGYSEDPLLTGEIATAYGSGLSGDDPLYLKVAPVIKHYFGYNKEDDRSVSSSNLPPRIRKEYSQAAVPQRDFGRCGDRCDGVVQPGQRTADPR